MGKGSLKFLDTLGRRGGLTLNNLGRIIVSNSESFIDNVKRNLDTNKTSASGKLSASIRPEFDIAGFRYSVKIMAEDYWVFVDKYTKARTGAMGKVSLRDSLQKWIKQKEGVQGLLRKIKEDIRPKKKKISEGKLLKRANATLAFLIARKMRRKGRQGTGFLTKEIEPFRIKLQRDMSVALKQDMIAEIREIKKENKLK